MRILAYVSERGNRIQTHHALQANTPPRSKTRPVLQANTPSGSKTRRLLQANTPSRSKTRRLLHTNTPSRSKTRPVLQANTPSRSKTRRLLHTNTPSDTKTDCLRYPPRPTGYPSAKHKAAERMGDRSPQSVRRPSVLTCFAKRGVHLALYAKHLIEHASQIAYFRFIQHANLLFQSTFINGSQLVRCNLSVTLCDEAVDAVRILPDR